MRQPVQYRSQPNFRMLTPVYPYGTDPSRDNPVFNPPLLRRTTEVGHWSTSQGTTKGRMSTDIGNQTVQVTVAYDPGVDEVIESGESILRLGPYEVRPWVDYVPVDSNVVDTALALAATISLLPGFAATHLGLGVIQITTRNQLDRIPIEVTNRGFAHLTLGDTDTGYLNRVDSTGAARHQTPEIT